MAARNQDRTPIIVALIIASFIVGAMVGGLATAVLIAGFKDHSPSASCDLSPERR